MLRTRTPSRRPRSTGSRRPSPTRSARACGGSVRRTCDRCSRQSSTVPGSGSTPPLRCARPVTRYVIGTAVTSPTDERRVDEHRVDDRRVDDRRVDELGDLAKRVLSFEHDRARHDRTKEAEIRVEFEMSAARYYQVLNRVIDSPAALAYDPQLVTRLQRLRHARTSARATRSFVAPGAAPEGREEER
ncbi:DUF3263 domain-containing protein [Curtobacterium flaccumfaciens pv. flaccumfaciens]|uniref:DUF3263 domain-containing protein n=1 Tax=Curtobacterium aurantiacum TaxID=3236919 RepID=A0ABS5VDY6_9MICO|nr:DUF3263 domain-containing protein [Curtobacterium flaccumfaciens pv. flaccumfaciens]MBT1587710.1 DUF3263 domain-containing protein [Curtobacterium flaccumfaciens pv. flaccumfaciens]MBT1676239.1 DUF3263 domain-containing protein [Curtobacterium flaccumfaciens pv. flaccumfaciens]